MSAGEPRYEADIDKAWSIAEKQRIELKTIDSELKINESGKDRQVV